ncbi:hypothetical protein FBQ99_02085 [Chloroflexi bacterium CFX2]|nr:hypothetical protein [Chloroflexi bacterium CFX2]
MFTQKTFFLSNFLPAILFVIAAFFIGFRNPDTFDAPALAGSSPIPAALFFLASGAIAGFSRKHPVLKENLPGLVLFFLFTLGYFLIASVLNKPEINTNNVFFAADNASWYQRMAAEDGWNTGTRGVHPLAHIIFRPLTAALSLLTGGDRFHANIILLSLAGGGCVLLMWKIVSILTENSGYAVLSASLLGLSASHLTFASVIETYIFSAFCLLFFIWLALRNGSAWLLAAAGVVTLGITITNIAQQLLTFLFLRRDIKQLTGIFSLVLAISIGLNLLSKVFYPVTEYFFLPQNLAGEQRFSQQIDIQRIGLAAENLFIYNMAAPQPYLSMRNEMPRFNFLPGSIQNYIWFGLPAFVSWAVVLALGLASVFFIRRDNLEHGRLAAAMLACLLFNFALHLGYGIEPFLYSADWTYALVLTITIGLQNAARRTWFMAAWLLLTMLIAINNLWLVYLIARQVSEFIS